MARGPLLSHGVLAMSCLQELARLAFSWITRAFAAGRSSWRPPRSSAPVVSVVATVREAPAVPADRVGSPAPMVAVPQQAANEAWLMSRMLVDPVVHDDCIAWPDATVPGSTTAPAAPAGTPGKSGQIAADEPSDP
jgi:hypothetical protein